jgi:hypothetical protein
MHPKVNHAASRRSSGSIRPPNFSCQIFPYVSKTVADEAIQRTEFVNENPIAAKLSQTASVALSPRLRRQSAMPKQN